MKSLRRSPLSSWTSPAPERPLAALLVAALFSVAAARAQDAQNLAIRHLDQVPSPQVQVRSYFVVADAGGEPLERLTSEQVSATLGEETMSLDRLRWLPGTNEGIRFVILVDVSKSISIAQFDEIRAAVGGWIETSRENDQAAIIAFGDESSLVADFTRDRESLLERLATLGPTDSRTVLHDALRQALELGQRRDPDLPFYPALIVLTDGRDEGSGLVLDDIVAAVDDNPAPIYTIGYSRLREPDRERYLSALRRLASRSGGEFFEAGTDSIESAYRRIRRAVEQVWVADFSCADCTADGSERRFQLTVSAGERVVSTGSEVRLFPDRIDGEAATVEPPVAEAGESDGSQTPDEAPSEPAPAVTSPADRSRGWGLFALLAVVGGALALVVVRRRSAPQRLPTAIAARSAAQAVDVPSLRLEQPIRPRSISFTVVRGAESGRRYSTTLHARKVVGNVDKETALQIEEPRWEGFSFTVSQAEGFIYVESDLAERPLMINGLSTEQRQVLKSSDLIGTGHVIMRVAIED